MQRLIVLAIVAALGWYGYNRYSARSEALSVPEEAAELSTTATLAAAAAPYKCDGRIYCSQMTSCEEATYFLRNCPGVKMDGNNDGVPCEKQWCRR